MGILPKIPRLTADTGRMPVARVVDGLRRRGYTESPDRSPDIMRDSLLIYVNGTRHDVAGSVAFSSLSDFLRYDLGFTGTKVVCAEGDCGSCTVFIGRANGDRIDYSPVTSCIQFLHQLDCTHIVTVEGLTPLDALNPIQASMVACHGAQCGYCTPGIVVSMYAAFEAKQTAPDEAELRSALVGNLCRCTGYQSIIRAGLETDAKKVLTLDSIYPPTDMLALFASHSTEAVTITTGERRHFKPVTVAEAVAFKADNPDCTIVAGATDIGVLINKGIRDPKLILNLSGIAELRSIALDGDLIRAGATATIAALEKLTAQSLPEYARFLNWFGSPPIKNAATIAGNIANGSPIGDSMPALFVLDAEIELTGLHSMRRVNINKFYTGYRDNVMAADELITTVFIPLPKHDDLFKLYKVSRRKDLDISAVAAAIRMRIDAGRITEARIAYGGVGPTIVRLSDVETFLNGRSFDEPTFVEAARMARDEVQPISDVRGSAEYRSQLAGNLLLKFFADARSDLSSVDRNGNGHPNGNGKTIAQTSRPARFKTEE